MCTGHKHRWRERGYPDLAEFLATARPEFWGQRALQGCLVERCWFGRQGHGLCPRHYAQWWGGGQPPLPGWAASPWPLPVPETAPPVCAVASCRLWAHPGAPWCFGHRKRWIRWGRPDRDVFVEAMAEHEQFTGERIDLWRLPALLRLEMAYVLQCRRDDATVRLIPWQVQNIVNALAGSGVSSLLEATEEEWVAAGPAPALNKRLGAVAFVRDAYRRIEALAVGQGCLRYWNTKMKREALVPIDDELHGGVLQQQRRVLAAYPAGTPVLFPRTRANLHGTIPMHPQRYRDALAKWLAACDVRDEHGRPVHLTPHQWRHTLGTLLINRDVPQPVVQKLLDHDTAEMTAHYANPRELHQTGAFLQVA